MFTCLQLVPKNDHVVWYHDSVPACCPGMVPQILVEHAFLLEIYIARATLWTCFLICCVCSHPLVFGASLVVSLPSRSLIARFLGKVPGANMGPIWGRQDPGGPHVGPMNFAIWGQKCPWLAVVMASQRIATNEMLEIMLPTLRQSQSFLLSSFSCNIMHAACVKYWMRSSN